MKNLILLILVFSAPMAFGKVKNFTPGEYSLSEGDEEKCGDGEFKEIAKDHAIYLGSNHIFLTKSEKETLDGDAPGDEKCKYETEYKIDQQKKSTLLKYTSVRVCGKKRTRAHKREAYINADRIDLNVTQTGDVAYTYFCKWELDE